MRCRRGTSYPEYNTRAWLGDINLCTREFEENRVSYLDRERVKLVGYSVLVFKFAESPAELRAGHRSLSE